MNFAEYLPKQEEIMKKIYTLLLISAISLGAMCQETWKWVSNENPVLEKGAPDSFEDLGVGFPSVLQIGLVYHMWYAGLSETMGMNIGHATSDDGITWTRDPKNPVLEKGLENTWNEGRVYLPSVLFMGGVFHMWFIGADVNVNENLGYATSTDGSTWTQHEGNPMGNIGGISDWDAGELGSGGYDHDGEKFQSWYSASPVENSNFEMGYATSADGISWVRASDVPVMENGGSADWDFPRVQPSAMVAENGLKHIWYSGGDFAEWQIGHATSEDGLSWEKDANNPVLTRGEPGSGLDEFVAFPSVLRDSIDDLLKMWYFGSGSGFAGSIYYAEYKNTTGIPGQAEVGSSISIYPNPATRRVWITAENQGRASISLCTMNGQLVYQGIFKGERLELEVASLPRGIYILQLSSGNEMIRKKLILH